MHGVEMTEDFASLIRQEIEALERELSENTTYRRIKALRAALLEYAPTESLRRRKNGVDAETPPPVRGKRLVRKMSPERKKAIKFAKEYLREKSTPIPTREVFKAMSLAGVTLSGKNPQNNLSAILSNSTSFVSHGRDGWVLAESKSAVQERDTATEGPEDDNDSLI